MSDIEQILRRELDDVAAQVRTRRVPVVELVAAGRSVRRRRRTVGATLSAAVVIAVLALATSVTGVLSTTPPLPAGPTPAVTRSTAPTPMASPDGAPGEAEIEAAAAWLRRWHATLPPVRDATTPQADERPGYALWEGRYVRLPRGPRLPDGEIGSTYTATDRGLLVSWYFDTGTDPGFDTVGGDYRQQLGWITPERRWVKVETGAVDKLVLSPDGSEYAYTIQPDAGRPTVLVVRGVRTDAARRRYPLPETWRLVGWNRTGLVLGVHDPQQGTSTYVWPPGAPAPTLIGKGLAPEVVSRGTRILGVAEGEDCRITVLDSTGAAPMSVKGCGPAKLSPDGRYLVRGLVVTDLDTGGSTDLVPRDAAGGGAPRTVAMHELVGPTSPFDWIDDRTVHLDVEVEEATYISLRCTVPTGPCVRVEE